MDGYNSTQVVLDDNITRAQEAQIPKNFIKN